MQSVTNSSLQGGSSTSSPLPWDLNIKRKQKKKMSLPRNTFPENHYPLNSPRRRRTLEPVFCARSAAVSRCCGGGTRCAPRTPFGARPALRSHAGSAQSGVAIQVGEHFGAGALFKTLAVATEWLNSPICEPFYSLAEPSVDLPTEFVLLAELAMISTRRAVSTAQRVCTIYVCTCKPHG